MPENTSTDYRINGICPKCGELQTFVITIKSTIMEPEPEKETEGKDNAGKGQITGNLGSQDKSGDVRPTDPKGTNGTTDSVPKSTDSGKSKSNNSTGGGKTK